MMGRCPKCSQLIDAAAKSCGNCAPTARHDDVEVEATCKLILEALDGKPEIDSELVKLVKAYEARGKRIAKLRNGLREALDAWDATIWGGVKPDAIKRLRALLEGT